MRQLKVWPKSVRVWVTGGAGGAGSTRQFRVLPATDTVPARISGAEEAAVSAAVLTLGLPTLFASLRDGPKRKPAIKTMPIKTANIPPTSTGWAGLLVGWVMVFPFKVGSGV